MTDIHLEVLMIYRVWEYAHTCTHTDTHTYMHTETDMHTLRLLNQWKITKTSETNNKTRQIFEENEY